MTLKRLAASTALFLSLAGCGEPAGDAKRVPAPERAPSAQPPTPDQPPPPSPSKIESEENLAALRRLQAVLDGMQWRCDGAPGRAERADVIKLRSVLELFERACRRALEAPRGREREDDSSEALRRRALVAEVADDIKVKVAGCARLSSSGGAHSGPGLCDVHPEEVHP